MARRLLPAVIVIPAVVGWVGWLGQQEGVARSGDGAVAVRASPTSSSSRRSIWWNAASLDRMDRERRRAERRLGVQYTATRVLAESPRLDDAVPRILQAICDSLGWTFGAMWWVDPQAGVLRCGDVWHSPVVRGGGIRGPLPADDVRPRRRPARPRLGERPTGLDPGRRHGHELPAGARSRPARACTAPSASRSWSAATSWASWRSSAARSSSPTRTCSGCSTAIGSQIGQFMKRKQAEEAVLQERYLLRHADGHRPGLDLLQGRREPLPPHQQGPGQTGSA